MKKSFLLLFALVALVGILNWVLLEPAFACNDKATHSALSEDSDCCFVHCSMHHQWVTSSSAGLMHNISIVDFIPASFTLHHDSPIESIFHPPQAF